MAKNKKLITAILYILSVISSLIFAFALDRWLQEKGFDSSVLVILSGIVMIVLFVLGYRQE